MGKAIIVIRTAFLETWRGYTIEEIITYLEVQVSLLREITTVTTSITLPFVNVEDMMSDETVAKAKDVQQSSIMTGLIVFVL